MKLLIGYGWLVAVLAGAGCKNLECGANTIEMNGKCVANVTPPGAECGPGTFFDTTSGRCLDNVFADGGGICGENTTLITDDAGNRVCVGTGGGAGDCSQPLPCPPPTMANSVSMCGRVFDLETSAPLDDGNPANGEPSGMVELRVYEPIGFVSDPAHAQVLLRGHTDGCGRFAIIDAPRPGTGFIALATEDVDGTGDNLVQTGIAAPVASGDVLVGVRAWVFRRATDEAWSAAAGLPAGTTFGSMGVYIPIFQVTAPPLAPFVGTPAAGVTVAFKSAEGNRTPSPENDYYFSDTNPLLRRTVTPAQSATGADGTALYVNQPGLGQGSGLGGAPEGTCWMTNLAAAPPGAAYVQERFATPDSCP